MESATDKDSGGLKASVTAIGLLQDPRIRRALVLGCGLQMLQQLSGINTVMYYSASIFRSEQPLAIAIAIAIGGRRSCVECCCCYNCCRL